MITMRQKLFLLMATPYSRSGLHQLQKKKHTVQTNAPSLLGNQQLCEMYNIHYPTHGEQLFHLIVG